MERVIITDVGTDKLKEIVLSLTGEKEALEQTISNIETEIFYREHPELKNNRIPVYVHLTP